MRIEAGVATDIGRVRDGNEDAYLVEPPLYAVADGMGGHRGGEVASQLALETVEDLFQRGKGTLDEQVREANRAVFQRSSRDRKVAGMGTTLTAALLDGDGIRLAHVGDSRAYLVRAGAVRRLTEDHTLVNRMIRAGEITADEAEIHPHRNVLTRSLGTEPEVEIDVDRIGLLDGDRLLLCSDGLTGMVTEDQIAAILEATPSPQDAADRLVRAANRAGGVDNITVIVLDVKDDEVGTGDGGTPAAATTPGGGVASGDRGRPPGDDRRRRLIRSAVVAAVVVVVLVAAFAGLRAYLDGQWYVGVANGHVAVYRGIPAEILGYSLSSVNLETAIAADEVQALPIYANLSEGINANGRDDALAIVDQIRRDLRRQARLERGTKGP
jgi:serine/threonine protein phosphatase PrpC